MAHFALLGDNNVVQQVIVVSDDDCGGGQYPESEPVGQAFIASLGLRGGTPAFLVFTPMLILLMV